MPDIPTHPDTGTDPAAEAAAARPRWKTALWIGGAVVVLAVVVVLHLTGVLGADSHR